MLRVTAPLAQPAKKVESTPRSALGALESQAFQAIEEKIRANVEAVLSDAAAARVPPRQAAMRLAGARVEEAIRYRRFRLM